MLWLAGQSQSTFKNKDFYFYFENSMHPNFRSYCSNWAVSERLCFYTDGKPGIYSNIFYHYTFMLCAIKVLQCSHFLKISFMILLWVCTCFIRIINQLRFVCKFWKQTFNSINHFDTYMHFVFQHDRCLKTKILEASNYCHVIECETIVTYHRHIYGIKIYLLKVINVISILSPRDV